MKKHLLFGLTFLLGTALNAQTNVEKLRSTVFKKDIESHVYFLASDELKGRRKPVF